jgi:hypothetical protein
MGETPLTITVGKGNVEMLQLLIDNGALPYINIPDNVNF